MATLIYFSKYLRDSSYRNEIHQYITREKNKELRKLSHKKDLLCSHCKGIGYVTAADRPIDMKFLYNSNIVNTAIQDTLDATIKDMEIKTPSLYKYVQDLGFLYSDLDYKNNARTEHQVNRIAKDLHKLAAGKGYKICPVCKGKGFYKVRWDQSIPIATFNTVEAFLAAGYCKIGLKKLINSLNINMVVVKTAETVKYPYVTKTACEKLAIEYSSQCPMGKFKVDKIPDNLLEAFAEYLLTVLQETIRVYTGLSKKALHYILHKNTLMPWIEFKSATIDDELMYYDEDPIGDTTQYISFYLDDWSKRSNITDLSQYIKDTVVPTFVTGLSKKEAALFMAFSPTVLKQLVLFTKED